VGEACSGACEVLGHCYALIMATTKRRTTKPLSPRDKAFLAEMRAAKAKGEDPARVVYKALGPEEKVAFVRRRVK